MQISVLEKLLQLISPKNSPEEEKSLEETLEQKVSSNETVNNCFLRSECAETRSDASEDCPHEQKYYVSKDKTQNNEDSDKINTEGDEEETEVKEIIKENNRSHLTSSGPRGAKAPQGILTKGELAEIRALFANLDDNEIQRLYKKVTK